MLRLVLLIVTVLAAPTDAVSAPPRGTIRVEATAATAHDLMLLERVARDLERHDDMWNGVKAGTKTFRLITYATGDVRGLTELSSTVQDVIACKSLRYQLWRLALKATAKRKVVVTFHFKRR